jgi:hypothetical protein
MGRKSVVTQYNMFEASGSMAANNTSSIVSLQTTDKATIHLKWTAGPVGEFRLQARNGSKTGAQPAPINDTFFTVDMGSVMTITGADSELLIVLNESPGTEIQIQYIRTSGTATDLQALIQMKALGA